MRRLIQRWITGAVLSVSIVAAAVGASYGQRLDVSAVTGHETFLRQVR